MSTRSPSEPPPRSDDASRAITLRPGRAVPARTEIVFLATRDRTGVERIARGLVGTAEVRRVSDLRVLAETVRREGIGRLHLVIDCCLPTMDPARLTNSISGLSPGSNIVLWGAADSTAEELSRRGPDGVTWTTCPSDSSHEEIARLLRALVQVSERSSPT